MGLERFSRIVTAPAALALALAGCAGSDRPQLPPATFVAQQQVPGEQYIIGPLDKLNIFVWRNPELSSQVLVRPDGRIPPPLLSDMPAVGKTPALLAADITTALSQHIQKHLVSVVVQQFSGARMRAV